MRSPAVRLRRLLRSFPRPLQETVRPYLRGLRRRSSAQRYPDRKYWTVIPEILIRSLSSAGRPVGSFLDDLRWGQYCIFLHVRIYDDLLDGHVGASRLRVAADLTLADGRKAFARHFGPRSSFWRVFTDLLAVTVKAIAAVDILQRRLRPPTVILRQYANISAVFKIGLAAACIHSDRRKQYKQMARCFDAIAIAGQIIDDLEDFEEDLRRRRFNSVAAILARTFRDGASPPDLEHRLAGALLYGDGTARVMQVLTGQLDRAEKALHGLRLPEVRRYLSEERLAVARLSDSLQRKWILR